MGAWGVKAFENDDALDWGDALLTSKGTEELLAPIRLINEKQEYLEAYECSEAIAAAEVIAAALSLDYSEVPASVSKWVTSKPNLFSKMPNIDASHATEARIAVEKILQGSELQELWSESAHASQWQEGQNNLLAKLEKLSLGG